MSELNDELEQMRLAVAGRHHPVYLAGGSVVVGPQFSDPAAAWSYLRKKIAGPGLVISVSARGEVLPEIVEFADGSCVADVLGEVPGS
jgi:hypothetical protein